MTQPEDSSRPRPLAAVDRLAILRELAATTTDATCLDSQFRPVETPEPLVAIGLTGLDEADAAPDHPIKRPIDNVHLDDRPKVVAAIGSAKSAGAAVEQIRFVDFDGTMPLHVVDLLDDLGVIVFVRGGDSDATERVATDASPVPPRRMVQHRDAAATFTWIDENTTAVLGWTSEELVGARAADLLHPDDLERAVEGWVAMLGGVEVEPVRLRYRTADDTYRWFEVRNTNHLTDPTTGYVESELIDVDAEMRAMARVRDSELQFTSLAQSLPVGVLQFDEDGEVVFANDWLQTLTGRDRAAITTLAWLEPSDRASVQARVRDAIEHSTDANLDIDVHGADGTVHVARLRLRPLPSSAAHRGAIASLEDITASLDLQERLRSQALTDPLTQLPNRRALHDWLATTAEDEVFALLFIDLDHFKIVNDALGHDTGDEFLVRVAEQIRLAVRPDDFVARLGGDEFVVGCTGVDDRDEAARIASRILTALDQPMRVDDRFLPAGCSIGIAIAQPGQPRSGLVSDADLAMYQAKRSGGRRHVFYDEDQRRQVEDRLRQEGDLRDALADRQFELHLQPMVELATAITVAHEVLVRWRHPTEGLLLPAQFVPTAERAGLVEELGNWILHEACRYSAELRAIGAPSRMSVNVSPHQLADHTFAATVLRALADHGVTPADLVLEVTETVFLDTSEDMLTTIESLAAAGIGFALDDFGSGYSSLNHLRLLPSQMVKIDHTYTADIGSDDGTAAIVEAMVDLAPRLGQTLVVEGIETAEQARTLVDLGVQLGQGYLFGHPVPASEIVDRHRDTAVARSVDR